MLIPKVGDMIRLKPILVESVGVDYFRGSGLTCNLSYIDEIVPRPFVAGDRVKFASRGPAVATVIATHGNYAWIEWESGANKVVDVATLVRVDP